MRNEKRRRPSIEFSPAVEMGDDTALLREYVERKRNECLGSTGVVNEDASGEFCGLVFDGILCWWRTKAGSVARQECPDDEFIYSAVKGNVTRYCEKDGRWFVSSHTNSSWTDYSGCGQLFIKRYESYPLYEQMVPIIKTVTHFGYGISLAALVLSVVIFATIKKLQCARVKLHMHLFMTFIMRAIMSYLKDLLFYKGIALYSDVDYADGSMVAVNPHCSWVCKAIVSAWHYFIVSNYMMVLMEGVYLHNLMFLNLFSDNTRITVYYVMGWGLPLLFLIPWIVLRIYFEDDYCWTKSRTYLSLLIDIPIALSIIINFVLFITFTRVLCIKLNSMYIQQRSLKYRKLTKSALILVPLFGVPYVISLILSLQAKDNEIVDLVYLFFDQTFTSFQGFFAAIIYCLINAEVRVEISRKYHSFRNKKRNFARNRTISHTQNISIPLHEECFVVNGHQKSPEHWQRKSTTYF